MQLDPSGQDLLTIACHRIPSLLTQCQKTGKRRGGSAFGETCSVGEVDSSAYTQEYEDKPMQKSDQPITKSSFWGHYTYIYVYI